MEFDEYISPILYFVLEFDESPLRYDFHCVTISPPHPTTITQQQSPNNNHPTTITQQQSPNNNQPF
ncbi:hypothetical protein HXZ87_13515 [Myroides sp. R163-1]|nr:hypothetical protein [Myroides sp. R163-1]